MNYLRHLVKSKQLNYINACIVLLLKVCEYLEYLLLVRALILFDYTGSALKCLLFKKTLSGAPTKLGFTIFQ